MIGDTVLVRSNQIDDSTDSGFLKSLNNFDGKPKAKPSVDPGLLVKFENSLAYVIAKCKENQVISLGDIDKYPDAPWVLTALMRAGNIEYIGSHEFRVRIQLDKDEILHLLKMGKILSERL